MCLVLNKRHLGLLNAILLEEGGSGGWGGVLPGVNESPVYIGLTTYLPTYVRGVRKFQSLKQATSLLFSCCLR